jgi:hypothetical protein
MNIKKTLNLVLLLGISLPAMLANASINPVITLAKHGDPHQHSCDNPNHKHGCDPHHHHDHKHEQKKSVDKNSSKVTVGEPTDPDNSYNRSKNFLMNHD